MKWLLLTTKPRSKGVYGTNVGDEFARLGIQRVINEVDPDPEIELMDKESTEDWDKPREFDRMIICGMPMFWSNENQTCSDIYWWDYLWNSYMTQEPEKVLAFGVGHVLVGGKPHETTLYNKAIEQVDAKTWQVIVREPIYGGLTKWKQSICPSAFCMMSNEHKRTVKLCNLMETGGHFGYLTECGDWWDRVIARDLSDLLQASGFTFMAHTHHEVAYAKAKGWPDDKILCFDSAAEYLNIYAQAECYVGNRMHGAAVCASTGAPTFAVTHDSRLKMVKRLGGHAVPITKEFTVESVKDWLSETKPDCAPEPEFQIHKQWSDMIGIMREFMS